MSGPRGVHAELGPSGYRTVARVGSHLVVADEPSDVGGTDTGPTPMELVAAALAGCISITLRMVAQRKGWPLEGVEADVVVGKEAVEGARPRDRFDVQIRLIGPLDAAMRSELARIAGRCPVHRILAHGTTVETTVLD
jgi:putative redox protein